MHSNISAAQIGVKEKMDGKKPKCTIKRQKTGILAGVYRILLRKARDGEYRTWRPMNGIRHDPIYRNLIFITKLSTKGLDNKSIQ
jgi:hypothetical protein